MYKKNTFKLTLNKRYLIIMIIIMIVSGINAQAALPADPDNKQPNFRSHVNLHPPALQENHGASGITL